MTSFVVILTPEAQEDILRLDVSVQTRILDKLEWMGENAEFIRHQMLKGAEWYNCFKYRVGDYRIVYSLFRQRLPNLTRGQVGDFSVIQSYLNGLCGGFCR
jgi:mRNA-degrading endonuclease RelE of RelBE toxin-antitoxin system